MLSRVRAAPGTRDHRNYVLRGIGCCARWDPKQGGSFQAFLDDMGMRPEGTTLDRIDNDAGYAPTNCRWATPKEQRANQRGRTAR